MAHRTPHDLAIAADHHLALARLADDHDEAVRHVAAAREAVRQMFALMFPDNA